MKIEKFDKYKGDASPPTSPEADYSAVDRE